MMKCCILVLMLVLSSKTRLFSFFDTDEEISLVLDKESAAIFPEGSVEIFSQRWRAIRVSGELDFCMCMHLFTRHSINRSYIGQYTATTGIVQGLTEPLAKANISIFYISTFTTDFALVHIVLILAFQTTHYHTTGRSWTFGCGHTLPVSNWQVRFRWSTTCCWCRFPYSPHWENCQVH